MNWFVIKENEHLGPFKDEDLKRLHKVGEISNVSMLWHEGMDEPQSYEKLFIEEAPPVFAIPLPEEDEDDEVPPPLPPEVMSPSVQKVSPSKVEAPPIPKTESFPAEEVPAVPVSKSEPVEKTVGKPKEEIEEEPSQEADISLKRKKSTPLKFVAYILLLLTLVGGGIGGWWYYASQFKPFQRPAKMDLTDYKKLIKTASSEGQNQFAIAMARDKSGIWISTNSPFKGEVTLKLNSIDGKVLSTKKINASSKGQLENRLIQFKNFEFENGQRLVDGWYEVELTTPSKLEVPLVHKFSKNQKTFDYKKQLLITSNSIEAFERALNSFVETQKSNDSIFWEELLQKYQTVNAMSLKIEKAMSQIFESDSNNWNNAIENFEKEYIRNFGNFFTSFVIQNEYAYEEIKNKDFHNKVEVITSYNGLTKIAKRVGAETMRALELLKSVKDPQNGRERLEVENKIKNSFKTINTTVSDRVEALRDQVSNT